MRTRLPPLLGPSELPLTELSAARLDGEVFAVDEAYAPVDEPDRPALRAAALRRIAPPGVVVEGDSALWIHGALDRPPERHTVCIPADARVRVAATVRRRVRQRRVRDDEAVTIAGVRVVTPLRAALDLLRSSAVFGDRERGLVARLQEAGGFDDGTLADAVDGVGRGAGARRARARVRRPRGAA